MLALLRGYASGLRASAISLALAGTGSITTAMSRRCRLVVPEYFHFNPVKAGLVSHPEDWPGSNGTMTWGA